MGKLQAKVLAGVLVGLLAAAIVLTVDQIFTTLGGGAGVNPLETIELKTYDWRLSATARPETARKDIALIEIDEFSLRNLEPYFGRWPWPRATHAVLIDYLARGRPKMILYDVNFAGPDTRTGVQYGESTKSGAESDKELAEAVRRAGNVIMLVDATYEITSEQATNKLTLPSNGYSLGAKEIIERKVIFAPYAQLAEAAAGFGHNLFVLDSDGPLRHMNPFVRIGDRAIPSLGVAGALRAGGITPEHVRFEGDFLVLGDRRMPMTARTVRSPDGIITYKWSPINFRGPALLEDLQSRPYSNYSFWNLFLSEDQILRGEKPQVAPSDFHDKIVFVGVTASALYDVFETPFSGARMPGIQVHAAVADDILSNRFLKPSGNGVRVATVVASGLLIGFVSTLLPAWWAAGATIIFIAAFGWIATQLFAGGYWLNLSQPVLASTAALFGGVAYQYFVEGRETRKMKRLFGQYVSKDVYEELVANPELARLGGHRRDMTVLFSDIRGFTTLSEKGQPEEIVQTLNEYFTRMVHLVFLHKGTLDKFVGDMVMALFGAPLSDPQHADHAVEAALDMVAELGKLNQKWKAEGRPELDIGIGINTGPMIAGNIGSDAIMSYTVIGDAVNLGSRLESLNKQYGTRIIISDATRLQLTGHYLFRPLGDVVVKGKTTAVAIFEVVGRADAVEASNRGAADQNSPLRKEARI
jgi:adenylate cyclase